MWKEDLLTPASAVRHVAVDNMNFVMHLRKDEAESTLKLPSPLATKRPQSAKAKELQEDPNLKVILKETGCRNSKCLFVDAEFVNNLAEKHYLQDQIVDLSETIHSNEAFCQEMMQEYDQIAAIQNELMAKVSQLEADYSNQADYLNQLKEEQVELETMISAKLAELRHLKEKKQAATAAATAPIIPDMSRKHNGVYTTTLTGKPQWSCCLAEKREARGCIEENSVGLRSELGLIKNNYLPYRAGLSHVLKEGSFQLQHHSRMNFSTTKSMISSGFLPPQPSQYSQSLSRPKSATTFSASQILFSESSHSLHPSHHHHSHHEHHHHHDHHKSHPSSKILPASLSQSHLQVPQNASHAESLRTNTWFKDKDKEKVKEKLTLPPRPHTAHHQQQQQVPSQNQNQSQQLLLQSQSRRSSLDLRQLTFAESTFNEDNHHHNNNQHQQPRRSSLQKQATVSTLPLNTTMNLAKPVIGKVRPGSAPKLSGNRPMSSPGGYQLYQM